MLKIGVTGGIGSGKSVVTKIFSVLGAPVYDADSRAKVLMINNSFVKEEIIREFGSESYDSNGNLNREYLSGFFKDPVKIHKLNAIVHPHVGKDFEDWAMKHSESPYVVKEAALMFESGSYKKLDQIIMICADEDLRIQRVLKRDPQRNEQQIRQIIERQMPEGEKRSLADFLIFNNNDNLLLPQVIHLHKLFLSK